jgi:hypothetical protein
MSFEETLNSLVALLGQSVEVSVFDCASGTTAMTSSGILGEGANLADAGDLQDEYWVFELNEGPASFELNRNAFHNADGDEEGLTIEQGSLRLAIMAL